MAIGAGNLASTSIDPPAVRIAGPVTV